MNEIYEYAAGEEIRIRARFLRMRGDFVEAQTDEGLVLVRADRASVERTLPAPQPEDAKPDAKNVGRAPETRHVPGPPSTRAVGGPQTTKGNRR